ncbi:LPXTG cell wall anchor domain-containing protein [Agromyces aureus]|uniref:Uncharacterized protein n=1 Tax=Agromyces aureus TaxID=453304 RepID=A0A191WCQ0_9MICO|nr:LPXTG cell wall anchor domain-containing protein [Agromyces aureus]ANJ25959.1 hypothetical protein ATC03_03615 [Agromyces aureus]
MIGGSLRHLELGPVVGGGTTIDVPDGVVIRVDILPLDCLGHCDPGSLPSTGAAGDLITWVGALLLGGAALLLIPVFTRHPIGRAHR